MCNAPGVLRRNRKQSNLFTAMPEATELSDLRVAPVALTGRSYRKCSAING
jgi:hypothetical protein